MNQPSELNSTPKPPEIWEPLPISIEQAQALAYQIAFHSNEDQVVALMALLAGISGVIRADPVEGTFLCMAAISSAYSQTNHFNDQLFHFLTRNGLAVDFRYLQSFSEIREAERAAFRRKYPFSPPNPMGDGLKEKQSHEASRTSRPKTPTSAK